MHCGWCVFFFLKQKTAYEMRISDWSSDVCSSDLGMFVTWTLRTMPARVRADCIWRAVESQPPPGAAGAMILSCRISCAPAPPRNGSAPHSDKAADPERVV